MNPILKSEPSRSRKAVASDRPETVATHSTIVAAVHQSIEVRMADNASTLPGGNAARDNARQ